MRSQRMHVRRMVVGRQMRVRRVAAFARVSGRVIARRHLVERSGTVEVAKMRNLVNRSDVLVMLDIDDLGHLLSTTRASLILAALLLGLVGVDERRLTINLLRLFLRFLSASFFLRLFAVGGDTLFTRCLAFSRVVLV